MSNELGELGKLPQQIIVDKINATNGSSLTIDQLLFGIPEVTGGSPNTRLKVTAKPYSSYVGTVELEYDRVDLSAVITPENSVFELKQPGYDELPPGGDYIYVSDLIHVINERFGLNLTFYDYINTRLNKPDPLLHQVRASMTIRAAEESLIYINSAEITMAFAPGFYDTALTTVIVNPHLDGFRLVDLTFPN